MNKTFMNKKMAGFSSLTLLVMLFTVSGIGYATSVSFTDTIKYWGEGESWAGQEWKTDVAHNGWDGNNVKDYIGAPDVTGGIAEFTANGNLSKITFNYTSPDKSWAMLTPGHLFINVLDSAADTKWDYVVTTMGTPVKDADGIPASLAAGNYNLYDISSKNIDAKRNTSANNAAAIAAANSKYILSGSDFTGIWSGYVIRDSHPIGVAASELTGLTASSVYFSGFPGEVTNDPTPWIGSAYYGFGTTGLDLKGKDIIIGWGTTCANDEIYAKVNNPVPEPGTLILFGSGLIAVAAMGRKIKNRK